MLSRDHFIGLGSETVKRESFSGATQSEPRGPVHMLLLFRQAGFLEAKSPRDSGRHNDLSAGFAGILDLRDFRRLKTLPTQMTHPRACFCHLN
jgi:hypothetical protein